MFVTRRILTGMATVSLFIAPTVLAADVPSRAPGLWTLTSKDNPFADWSMCVDDSHGHFIDSDVWSDFEKECKVTTSSLDGSHGAIKADCELSGTGDVKLALTYSGDFQKSYRFESVTGFKAAGEQVSQTIRAEVKFVGQCPAELKPGMKKMTRTGIVLGK